ncbi:hypothetical protein BDR03DRAFT_959375, partial [Suillus americanus]
MIVFAYSRKSSRARASCSPRSCMHLEYPSYPNPRLLSAFFQFSPVLGPATF